MDMVSSALSALNAFSVGMEVTANNIANVNTDGFKAKSARYSSGPNGEGVVLGEIRSSSTGGPLYSDHAPPLYYHPDGYVEGSNTDLVREFTNLIVTQQTYAANAKTIATYDQVTGALVNMIA